MGGFTMSMFARRRRRRRAVAVLSLLGSAVIAVMVVTSASARVAAAPQNQALPTISGPAAGRQDARRTSNGTLVELARRPSPTSGSSATPPGTTAERRRRHAEDVHGRAGSTPTRPCASQVTATNADGSATATSKVTDVVSSKGGPANTAAPAISGTREGRRGARRDSTGTWTGGVALVRVPVAALRRPGRLLRVRRRTRRRGSYGVRSADAGNTLRVVVTATNLSGSTNAVSSPTQLVVTNAPAPPPTPAREQRADDQVRRAEARRAPDLRALQRLRRRARRTSR